MATAGAMYIPKLNPIHFHRMGVSSFWRDEIPYMEDQRASFCQKYQTKDIIHLQFLAAFDMTDGSIAGAYIVDQENTTVHALPIYYAAPYGNLGAYFIKENMPTLDEGVYYIKLSIDFDASSTMTTFLSEPIYVATRHYNTLMIAYRHTLPIFDCWFNVLELPQFYLRVEGGLKSEGFTPGGKFTMYHDLDYRPVMLQSQPFNSYRYIFGGSYGIPNWMADVINRAFGLDYTYIDGVRYMRNEGAKLERKGDETSPLAGYSMELLQVENDYSEMHVGQSGAVGGGGVGHDGVWNDDATVDDTQLFSIDEEPA